MGNEIVYTGHGGRDDRTGQQVADQQFTHGNAALAHNKVSGLPVRVIRGAQLDSAYSPQSGYRYDGLYRVDGVWEDVGKSGFKIWRFRLIESDGTERPPLKPGAEEPVLPPRRQFTTTRVVRDSDKSRRVKEIYDYTCQVCGIRLDTPAGPYAEAAHIKALGIPHNGPDIETNILCLCPNHHVLFDDGAIAFTDDFRVLGIPGQLRLVLRHEVCLDFVRYHREHFGVLVECASVSPVTD